MLATNRYFALIGIGLVPFVLRFDHREATAPGEATARRLVDDGSLNGYRLEGVINVGDALDNPS
jgi:hypothetical protein